ncbi:Mor transcription activator family protein [Stenotrophomonas sp. 364]|uniref:Mor transcription activator family protein n=1 Tax=Stenotrophomonas sp. 364 TaxID=2691571 RepID=UPI001319B394|nr:Mor transcription activator family protein [Stenotrophomonas sp. 364]QHB72919.1 transcriptional regulator [Stenotrophomonas sp. 364]
MNDGIQHTDGNTPPAATDETALAPTARRWAPALAAFVEVMNSALQKQGLTEAQAAKLATAGVLALASYLGGRQFYLPRGERLRKALRDAEIYQRAKRGNIQQLAAEYGLSDIYIYKICRIQRALHREKIQSRFDFDDAAP